MKNKMDADLKYRIGVALVVVRTTPQLAYPPRGWLALVIIEGCRIVHG